MPLVGAGISRRKVRIAGLISSTRARVTLCSDWEVGVDELVTCFLSKRYQGLSKHHGRDTVCRTHWVTRLGGGPLGVVRLAHDDGGVGLECCCYSCCGLVPEREPVRYPE